MKRDLPNPPFHHGADTTGADSASGSGPRPAAPGRRGGRRVPLCPAGSRDSECRLTRRPCQWAAVARHAARAVSLPGRRQNGGWESVITRGFPRRSGVICVHKKTACELMAKVVRTHG